jgi:hypothetical protein
MRVVNMFIVCVAASLILSAVADAAGAPRRGESARKSDAVNGPSLRERPKLPTTLADNSRALCRASLDFYHRDWRMRSC